MNLLHRSTPFKLGLTGGIGSGKSTVANVLKSMGAQVVDADSISRSTTLAHGAAMPSISQIFGPEFVTHDGALNRDLMRKLIFSQCDARSKLEAIIHPLIQEEIAKQVATSTTSFLIFDVPLLVESPYWRKQLDRIWIVDCTENTQIFRVQHRNGWDRASVQAVIASQAPRAYRMSAADAVIFNDDLSLRELTELVKQLAATFGL